jgi:TRAP-type C4-dicarboxylate transport system permease small subunit
MSSAEELARYFMICLTFLASSYVTIEGGQIRMEEFQGLLPPRLRWYLQMLIEISGVVMFSVIGVASAITIGNNMENQTPTLEMPFWLFMGPLLVGSLLLVIETALSFFHTLRRRRPEDKHTVLI